jgi:hypothetical protein
MIGSLLEIAKNTRTLKNIKLLSRRPMDLVTQKITSLEAR